MRVLSVFLILQQNLMLQFNSLSCRFDESVNYVELDYPRDMSMFAGVGNDIDAVFQWKNGKFSGNPVKSI